MLDPLTAPEPHQLDGPGSSFFNPRRSLSLNYKQDIPPHIQQLRDQLRQNGIPAPTHIPSKPIKSGRRFSFLSSDRPPVDTVHKRSQSLDPSAQPPSYRARSHSVTAILLNTPTTQLVSAWQKIAPRPNEPNRTNNTTSQKKGPVRPSNPKELPKSSEDYKKSKKPALVPAPSSAPRTVPSASSPASIPADTKPSTPTARTRPSRKEKQTPPLSSRNDSRLRNPILIASPHKTPQAHHGTSDILSDRINHHVNRSPELPPPSSTPPTTKPTLRHTGSFRPKPSGEMAFQPPVDQTKMVSPHVTRASLQASPSRPPTYASRAPSRAPSAAGSVASSRAPSVASSRVPSVAGSAAPGASSGSKSHRKHRAPKSGRPFADIIDRLDETGPAYHHGGPYDATLASVNANKKKAPLEAVKESNMEALKATPLEYIHDSLTKHVPLQGTSMVPPGMSDWNGRVMNYKEGADLMREPDAAGGAYKRYDCFDYHPDDLKGKGQSYLIEKEEKENKAKLRKQQQGSKSKSSGRRGGSSYELQDQRRGRGQDESSAPLLPPKDDHLQTPIRMHRHASAGAPSQQSRHTTDSRRSERSRSHSYGHQDAAAVPRTSSISSNVSPMSSTHSIRRKDVGSPTSTSLAQFRAELQGVSQTVPIELSGDSMGRYRSELQGDDIAYGRSRSNSAGHRIADGIKRHLGSLRRK